MSRRKSGAHRRSAPRPEEINTVSTLFFQGRYAEAEPLARSLTERYPRQGANWKVLGATLQQLGRGAEAVMALQRSATLLPGDAALHNNLGALLKELGRYEEAEVCFQRALATGADLPEVHCNQGLMQRVRGTPAEAEASFRRALALRPNFPEASFNLGNCLYDLGRFSEAEGNYRGALKGRPDWPEAHSNLGNTLAALGRLMDADGCYREALRYQPDYLDARSSLLVLDAYSPEHTASEYLAEARQYGQYADARASAPFTQWLCEKNPQRLRIGLVSGDLRNHPVGYFFEAFLAAIDHARLELFAYPTTLVSDELTERLMPHFASWTPIAGLSDEAAAHAIQADGVHLLIDLAGHTALNRLGVFAWKPAPVQVSWLGYFSSTGVAAMDYILADPVSLPEQLEADFTEKVWRLPETRLCFTPPDTQAEVAPLPALANRSITFGCFNNLTKLNDAVIVLWARVLAAQPDSRLFLKTKQFADPSVRQSITERFAAHGVAAERLILEGSSPRAEYLATYSRVDIALDPFPFTGGTTTVEALWMGVPVLTLRGDRFISRQGVGLLTNAGLNDWIADDADDYVRRAVAHASNLERLSHLRQSLRPQLESSPLLDAPRFARYFEHAVREMWDRGPVGQSVQNDATAIPGLTDAIEIVSATRLSEQEFWQRTALGISLYRLRNDHRVTAKIQFENHRGLSEIYNERILATDGPDLLVFVHDDVWLDDCFLADRVRDGLCAYDVIGVAGNRRRVRCQPAWIFTDERLIRDSRGHLSGTVGHGHSCCGTPVVFGPVPADCELLDGVFLATRRSTLKAGGVRFDPQFDFHFYDLDFCRSARKGGLRLGTWPIAITHQSNGGYGSDRWKEMFQIYLRKWRE